MEHIESFALIVNRIKQLAEDYEITGAELGTMLGLKKSPLTDWKNGKSKPTVVQLMTMCEIFATSSDFLLFGTTGRNTSKHHSINENELELVETYCKLDRRGKHKLHTTIYEELDRIKEEHGQANLKQINAG